MAVEMKDVIVGQFPNTNTFAYYTLFQKLPPGNCLVKEIYGVPLKRYDLPFEELLDPTIYVDAQLKDEWLNALNNIRGVKIISTCTGHDGTNFFTHVIFVLTRKFLSDEKTINIVKTIKSVPRTYGLANLDNLTEITMFCIAAKKRYNPLFYLTDWFEWWDEVADYIDIAVNIAK